jgi:hypothetical protein
MRKPTLALAAALLALACLFAPAAQASFGINDFDVRFSGPKGENQEQAGSHPFAMTTSFSVNTVPYNEQPYPDGQIKDIEVLQMPGFVGDQTAVSQCATADFLTLVETAAGPSPSCADSTAIGFVKVNAATFEGPNSLRVPLYNLVPPPGKAAKIGFNAQKVPVTIDVGTSPNPPYNLLASSRYISQVLEVLGVEVTLWGVPADPRHDAERGHCLDSGKACAAGTNPKPFLTLPRACQGPLATEWEADSWQSPGNWLTGFALSHDDAEPPNPQGMVACEKLGFSPEIDASPTAKAASSPTGLDFSLDVEDEGLKNPEEGASAASDIRKTVVTLPEGMSANPSIAEGLNVCTEAQLAKENAFSEAGEGCPGASKIGTVEVQSPLVDEPLSGALYIAKPYENPFESLLAMYLVIRNRNLGVFVAQPLKVEPDPVTGQLTTVADELPQLPFSHFRLHFREGARSPLTTPQACGSYAVNAMLYPWSGGPPVPSTKTFEIVSGPNGAPCPLGGLPPFKPGLSAGTLNNRAGSFSDFNLRLSRSDSEQEITHFSIKLPPGITGKLAGVPYCPDAAIEAAKARTGPHGGQEELDSPSCPAASQIGTTLAGAGVGPSLTYAPGKVYLAGPYHGSNLSMVAITAGVVGPFDIGTVVVQEGFKIDPETAEVFIDSTGSDPIPHIIRGIPVHLRDIRAYVDRPEFTLNPTDCTRTSTASTVLGSGLDFVSEADDNPITVTSPFQAADCAALRFKPQLGLKLKGGTNRGAHPAFSAHLKMTGIGEAGIAYSQVTLPRSEFIENAHFKTICTRVQFKEGAGNGANCPPGSIYGSAKASTPILGEPLTGPVFLRSSEHQLPDLVIALHNSQVDFDLVGRVDSVKGGGLRNTFEAAPDAPVSSFDLYMQGGSKGLFVNSTNLCAKTYRAKSVFIGQNGKRFETKPKLKAKCKGKKHKKAHKRHKRVQLRAARAAG